MTDQPNRIIDSTSTDNWARTWVIKFRNEIPEYKKKYSETDLFYDMVAGELPWTEIENVEVLNKIPSQEGFNELLTEYKEAFGSSALATMFGVVPQEVADGG